LRLVWPRVVHLQVRVGDPHEWHVHANALRAPDEVADEVVGFQARRLVVDVTHHRRGPWGGRVEPGARHGVHRRRPERVSGPVRIGVRIALKSSRIILLPTS